MHQYSLRKWLVSAIPLLLTGGVVVYLPSCQSGEQTLSYELVWVRDLFNIGSQSSPRAADFNNDGILDIAIGAGRNENQKSEKGILAIDGKTGSLLWAHESSDQVYGSPSLYDVTGDSVSDVFIGGRSQCLKALDGKDGKLIWEYGYHLHANDPILQHARFNFNSNAMVPDQNGDRLADVLAMNGGNSLAVPGSINDRYPGVLILFGSLKGEIIACDTMPDGGESYMSPVIVPSDDARNPWIIFGTGGETLDGNLYKIRLSDFADGRLTSAAVIASESGHGFIAPPVVADFNGDGHADVVAISHGSTIFALDIRNDSLLWKQRIPYSENSNSFAVGRFTADETPDVFTFVSRGTWPNNTGSLQVMLNGKDGRIEYMDSIGCTGFSSPVAIDTNGDGRDECIISINEFDCEKGFTNTAIDAITNKLIAIDFTNERTSVIDEISGFKNIFTTPLLTDLDGNGHPDLVYCQYFSQGGLLTFRGMRIKRLELNAKIKNIAWGAYMNSAGDGMYRNPDE